MATVLSSASCSPVEVMVAVESGGGKSSSTSGAPLDPSRAETEIL